jgi:23S rRNA pseudouridine1911/1915/1917 synthase
MQHCIQQWCVTINHHTIKKSAYLASWDVISIWSLQRFQDFWYLQECGYIDLEVKIQTDDYAVIVKPKWVLSHPTSIWEVHQPSVVWFLYHRFGSLPSVWSIIRAGLIHRLDKMTDGLMICILSEKWLAHFSNLFRQKSQSDTIAQKEWVRLKKYYHATCHLTPTGVAFLDHIEMPYIIESLVKAKLPWSRSGKIGITKIISKTKSILWDAYCELNIEILTGRTHQIRYHLSNCGLPIIGDYLYGSDDTMQLWLTAYQLDFVDPDGYDKSISL